ncbi:MAG: glycosyltransferase, partial [Chloroflexota bacterium]
ATPLRVWDFAAAQRVDAFIAGSYNAARRIAKYYRRECDTVQPPVETGVFTASEHIGDYFLVISRLQPYKRIDLAVEACSRLGLPLHVIGQGPDRSRLERLAGPTIRFLGHLPDEEVRRQFAECRAFILPGEEDFGLTPVEAQASGRPVIAYGAGGALETVKDGVTGIFFHQQTVAALETVLRTFDDRFDVAPLQAHARTFDTDVFVQRMFAVLEFRYREHRARFCP